MNKTKTGAHHKHSHAYAKTLERQVASDAVLTVDNIKIAIGLLETASGKLTMQTSARASVLAAIRALNVALEVI